MNFKDITKGDILFISNDPMIEHWIKVDDVNSDEYIEVTTGVTLIKQPTQEGLGVIPLQLFGINGNEAAIVGGSNCPILVNLKSFTLWGKVKSSKCLDRFVSYTSGVRVGDTIESGKRTIIGA